MGSGLLSYFILYYTYKLSKVNFFYFPFEKNGVYGGMEKMTLSFKVDPGLKQALEKLAVEENRSLSNYVVTVLMKHLEEKGVDWRQERATP